MPKRGVPPALASWLARLAGAVFQRPVWKISPCSKLMGQKKN